jgi:hypothetical protein
MAGVIVDRDQSRPVEGIGVVRIADEVGRVVAGLIVVGPVAVIEWFRIGDRAVIALPAPGADALVIEGIVRRRVEEHVVVKRGPIEIGIVVVIVRQPA